jgi:Peptidase C13 family
VDRWTGGRPRRYVASIAVALALPIIAVRAQTHLVIVSGLGGEAKYRASFAKLSQTLADAASKKFGIPVADIAWFGEDSVSKNPYFRGQSTKTNVERAMGQLAARSGTNDQVVLVLIGHGSGDGADSKISIPGPDLSATDFAQLLSKFTTQRVAFIDLTSASGDMLPVVAARNRVVITATKSSFERNESHFAEFFVDAFSKDVADTDKDGRVSLLEAFRYAVVETKRLYDTDTRLQTEHAQLDDMGAKAGVSDPDGRSAEGVLARRFFLDAGMSATAANDPQLASLYKDKFALEDQIDQLRLKKKTMTPESYDDALEDLLVQLARKAKTIREMEGRKS